MPSTDSTVARRIFGRCASKTQHGGYALWCPALNTAELDRLRDQKFESGSLQRRVRNELSRGQTNEPRHHHHIAGVNLGRRSCVRSVLAPLATSRNTFFAPASNTFWASPSA